MMDTGLKVVAGAVLALALGLAVGLSGTSAQDTGGLPEVPAFSLTLPGEEARPFPELVDHDPGASAWMRTDQAAVRLISARSATGGEETVRLGLQFALAPGWKVYWRSAGDAGYPPALTWLGSENLAEVRMSWPAPHRFELFGIQTAGYSEEVVFPLTAHLREANAPLRLQAEVDYLICKDLCIPGLARLSLPLPSGPGESVAVGHLIDRFAAQVPGPGHGITLDAVTLDQRNGLMTVAVSADPPLVAPDLFVEGPLGVEGELGRGLIAGAPSVRLMEGGHQALLTAPLLEDYVAPAPVPLTFTITDGERGLEVEAEPAPGPLGPAPRLGGEGEPSLVVVLGFALLGGLILNLMPCVLPVLSLKIMGFVSHGGASRAAVRGAFLATALGIVFAFLALATALAGLKLAGTAIGWGIQFQQPWFLIGMVALLSLFAANLWGTFEIPLPGWVSSVGAGHGVPHSWGGHFATGIFATLLATPCSAPFLGTAVGFALSRGPLEILLIFLVLGLGMAAPYLLVVVAPHLATRLPRPGPWMVTVRKIMAVALLATGLWLLSVLAVTLGLGGALAVALLLLAAVGLLALRPRLPALPRRAAPSLVLVLVILALAVPAAPPPAEGYESPLAGAWQPFSPERVEALVAEGQVVFVDVTAEWCITCQVNKRVVLDRAPVAEALTAPGVVALQADWTRPDPQISAFLAAHGRYGIPFNIVYGPGAPEGLALPELLTPSAVMDALEQASGRASPPPVQQGL